MHKAASGKSVSHWSLKNYPLNDLNPKILAGVAIVDSFITYLGMELERTLPGREAQDTMIPPWRRDQPGDSGTMSEPIVYRDAAVLILLYEQDAHWYFPLIERSEHPGPHSRQIALPGGSIEKGERAEHAAFREFEEELGASCADFRFLGALSPLLVPVSRFRILPFVAFSPAIPVFRPAPAEVAGWFPVEIRHVADGRHRSSSQVKHGDETRIAPCFMISGHTVWGATAMVLAELASVLGRMPSCAVPDPVR